MSPTLLELIVAVLLVALAWRIGVWLAPRVFGSGASLKRDAKSSTRPDSWPPEKNITPPAEQAPHPQNSHGNVRK